VRKQISCCNTAQPKVIEAEFLYQQNHMAIKYDPKHVMHEEMTLVTFPWICSEGQQLPSQALCPCEETEKPSPSIS
jgi:hypothetical protein